MLSQNHTRYIKLVRFWNRTTLANTLLIVRRVSSTVNDHAWDKGKTSLHINGLLIGAHVTGWEGIELIFRSIKLPVLEPEDCARDEGNDSHGAVVPDEEGIFGERDESLAKSSGDSRHEEREGGDERTHVLWRLGETILERGDGSEDFGQRNQDVRSGLGPHIDVNIGAGIAVQSASGSVRAARRALVDVVLENASPNHGHGASEETSSNLLDGSELDADLSETWVDDKIAKRDEDEECERI